MSLPAGFKLGKAIWKNAEHDTPIEVVGYLGEFNGAHYIAIKGSNTGIPLGEVVYPPPRITKLSAGKFHLERPPVADIEYPQQESKSRDYSQLDDVFFDLVLPSEYEDEPYLDNGKQISRARWEVESYYVVVREWAEAMEATASALTKEDATARIRACSLFSRLYDVEDGIVLIKPREGDRDKLPTLPYAFMPETGEGWLDVLRKWSEQHRYIYGRITTLYFPNPEIQLRLLTQGDNFNHIKDATLRGTAQFAYNAFPDWRFIGDKLISQRTNMIFQTGTSASPSGNTLATGDAACIRVHPRCRDFHVVQLAETLVHESIHSTSGFDWGLEEEIMAHQWGARFWEACRHFCPKRIPENDKLVEAYKAGTLREYVLSVPEYREKYARFAH